METREDIVFSGRRASDTRAGDSSRRRGERGSVLIFVMLAAAVLAAAVASALNSSTITTRSLSTDEAEAASAAVAEFGANLAAGDIAAWFKRDANADLDYVYGENGERLYVDPASGPAVDNRRFRGTFGDREFRVMVRSVDLAKKNRTKPAGWLWSPGAGEFLYEITSSARPKHADFADLPAERRMEALVNQVVSVSFRDGWNSAGDIGPLFVADPANFRVAMGENIVLSGEDHEIAKYYVEKFDSDPIVTPLKLPANTANFFGAKGNYWRSGYLTLNYRKQKDDNLPANPHRPRTLTFSGGADSRAMAVADKAREYDTYLLGGKSTTGNDQGGGRTVTVDMDEAVYGVAGRINETTAAQTNEGGEFNIVLGKFEDLRNLYINMAGVSGFVIQAENWFQMYVGQYTNSARTPSGRGINVVKSLPNYGGPKIRAQTVHLMKNRNDEFLVRLYAAGSGANPTYYAYPAPGAAWTGMYTWAKGEFRDNEGLKLTGNAAAGGAVPGQSANQQAVARTFFWQELVGYQLVRRREVDARLANGNEPAVRTRRDSGTNLDKRTMYRLRDPKDPESRVAAGFDEIYQAYYLSRDYAAAGTPSNSRHPLYGTEYSEVSPGHLQDRFDSIFVYEKDANGVWGVSEKRSMHDFLFEKDFSEKGDGSLVRDALALFIAFEDQMELDQRGVSADYNYTDMMFTIYISPALEQEIQPYTMFPLLTDQWWEQNPDNGLTGNPAHPGLTSNQDPSTASMDDVHQANYDLLAYTPKADPDNPDLDTFEKQVYSMRTPERVNDLYFLRAKFGANPSGTFEFLPARDEHGNEIAGYPYYYTEDDVNSYIIHQWNLKKKEYGNPEYWETADEEFKRLVPSRFALTYIGNRWDKDGVERPTLTGDSADSSYKPLDAVLSLRRVAAEVLGYKYQSAPVAATYGYERVEDEDNPPAAARPAVLGFLAGEMIQEADGGNGEWVVTDLGDSVECRDHVNEQKDGSATPIREFLFDASDISRPDPEDPHAADRNAAVDMCYEDYYAGTNDWDEVKAIYGGKDRRYSIGFHRSGDDPRYAERFAQDHYEVVFLGQKGFNPYMTTTDGRFIAKNSLVDPGDPDPESRPDYRYAYKYGNDGPIPEEGKVPDFVFNKPIDGAGIMIVNGNLIVSDVFAYHGMLLVLGDVVVRPAYRPDRLVYGPDGNPIDAYGNSLRRRSDGVWYYSWFDAADGAAGSFKETTVALDEGGAALRDEKGDAIPVAPLYARGADAVRGRLVVQGNLLVGGKLLTESTPVPGTEGEYVTGEINAYASDAAADLTKWLSGVHKDLVKVVSWTSENRAAFQEDVDRLWSGSVE